MSFQEVDDVQGVLVLEHSLWTGAFPVPPMKSIQVPEGGWILKEGRGNSLQSGKVTGSKSPDMTVMARESSKSLWGLKKTEDLEGGDVNGLVEIGGKGCGPVARNADALCDVRGSQVGGQDILDGRDVEDGDGRNGGGDEHAERMDFYCEWAVEAFVAVPVVILVAWVEVIGGGMGRRPTFDHLPKLACVKGCTICILYLSKYGSIH